jgi:hypothetical protein
MHDPKEIHRLIVEAATRYNIDPSLALSVAHNESGFNPRAVSKAGAKGVMQLMDGTARRFGVQDPFDPVQSIEGGMKYLDFLLKRYAGTPDPAKFAVAAYNSGEHNVDRYGDVPPFEETQRFVRNVGGMRQRLFGTVPQPEPSSFSGGQNFTPGEVLDVYDPTRPDAQGGFPITTVVNPDGSMAQAQQPPPQPAQAQPAQAQPAQAQPAQAQPAQASPVPIDDLYKSQPVAFKRKVQTPVARTTQQVPASPRGIRPDLGTDVAEGPPLKVLQTRDRFNKYLDRQKEEKLRTGQQVDRIKALAEELSRQEADRASDRDFYQEQAYNAPGRQFAPSERRAFARGQSPDRFKETTIQGDRAPQEDLRELAAQVVAPLAPAILPNASALAGFLDETRRLGEGAVRLPYQAALGLVDAGSQLTGETPATRRFRRELDPYANFPPGGQEALQIASEAEQELRPKLGSVGSLFALDVPRQVGQVTADVVVGRGLGVPGGRASTGAMGAVGQAEAMFEDALRQSGDTSKAAAAFRLGLPVGATEAFGLPVTKGIAKRPLREALVDVLSDALQEYGQTYAEDVVAKNVVGYDPEREIGKDAARNALIATITSAGFGGAGLLTGRRPSKKELQDVVDSLTPQQQAELAVKLTEAEAQSPSGGQGSEGITFSDVGAKNSPASKMIDRAQAKAEEYRTPNVSVRTVGGVKVALATEPLVKAAINLYGATGSGIHLKPLGVRGILRRIENKLKLEGDQLSPEQQQTYAALQQEITALSEKYPGKGLVLATRSGDAHHEAYHAADLQVAEKFGKTVDPKIADSLLDEDEVTNEDVGYAAMGMTRLGYDVRNREEFYSELGAHISGGGDNLTRLGFDLNRDDDIARIARLTTHLYNAVEATHKDRSEQERDEIHASLSSVVRPGKLTKITSEAIKNVREQRNQNRYGRGGESLQVGRGGSRPEEVPGASGHPARENREGVGDQPLDTQASQPERGVTKGNLAVAARPAPQPRPVKPNSYDTAVLKQGVEKARTGSGYTFTPDLSDTDSSPGYIVTLTSEYAPADQVSPSNVINFRNRWLPIIKQFPNLTIGTFHMGGEGKYAGNVSIDLNVNIPDRETAIKLGKIFNQQAIWDNTNQEVVEIGGDGTAVLKSAPEIKRALEEVLSLEQAQFSREPKTLFHYSDQPRKQLKTEFMGTGKAGAERRRTDRPAAIHAYPAGSKPEKIFGQPGQVEHKIEGDFDIYDVAKDQDGIVAQVRSLQLRGELKTDFGTEIENRIKDAGYDGYTNSNYANTPGYDQVKLFKDVEVKEARRLTSPVEVVGEGDGDYINFSRTITKFEREGFSDESLAKETLREPKPEHVGRKVFVYFNLHKMVFSAKSIGGADAGKVLFHTPTVELSDVQFKVSEAGRQRVLKEQRKNVHAGVVGTVSGFDAEIKDIPEGYEEGTYNPYKYSSFVDKGTEEPLAESASVILSGKRIFYKPVEEEGDEEFTQEEFIQLARQPVDPFYSTLARALERKMPPRATASQVRAIIKDPQNGVKEDEIKWTGILDYLEGKDKVSKEEVATFLRNNSLQVEEVSLGGGDNSPEGVRLRERMEEAEREWEALRGPALEEFRQKAGITVEQAGYYLNDISRRPSYYGDFAYYLGKEKAERLRQAHAAFVETARNFNERVKKPIYESYKLEGGRNYQELLFTLPVPQKKSPNKIVKVKFKDGRPDQTLTSQMSDEKAQEFKREWEARDNFQTIESITIEDILVEDEENVYKAPHFNSQKQLLAHVRFDERVDEDGNSVLFVEEIQSDWHQAGRKKGYKGEVRPITQLPEGYQVKKHTYKGKVKKDKAGIKAEHDSWLATKNDDLRIPEDKKAIRDALVKAFSELTVEEKEEHRKMYNAFLVWINPKHVGSYTKQAFKKSGMKLDPTPFIKWANDVHPEVFKEFLDPTANITRYYTVSPDGKKGAEFVSESEAIKNTINELNKKRQEAQKGAVPDAPLKKNWHEFVLKRMLRYAAENGFDKLAWTTGKHQVARYETSMRKVVDRIEWERAYDPDEVIIRAMKGGAVVERFEMSLTKTTRIKGEDAMLEDLVGEHIAAKIRDYHIKGSVEGDDLTIGGEGMKGFYDKIVPYFLNKYGKKWGVKVGTAHVGTGPEIAGPNFDTNRLRVERVEGFIEGEEQWYVAEYSPQGQFNGYVAGPFRGQIFAERALEQARKQYTQPIKYETVHSVDITDAMKESVLYEGQPQFARNLITEGDVFRVAEKLDSLGNVFQNSTGRKFDYESKEDRARLMTLMLERIKNFYAYRPDDAQRSIEWYDESVERLDEIMKVALPGVGNDPNQLSMFKLAVALTSPSVQVPVNFQYGFKAMERFDPAVGLFPTSMPPDQTNPWEPDVREKKFGNNSRNLDKVNRLTREKFGGNFVAALNFLNEVNPETGEQRIIGDLGRWRKVGRFYLNLEGVDDVTLDMWIMRFWNRYTGTIIHTTKSGVRSVQDDPPTDRRAKFIRDFISELSTKTEKALGQPMSARAFQALVWYMEKEVWVAAGLKGREGVSFDEAAIKFLPPYLAHRTGRDEEEIRKEINEAVKKANRSIARRKLREVPRADGPETKTGAPQERGRSKVAIKPSAYSRRIYHQDFGLVFVSDDQSGVPSGRLRVVDESGLPHVIKKPHSNQKALRVSGEANFARTDPTKTDPTKTPEFKRWFGDSKVVDENGQPLVVYKGMPAQDADGNEISVINRESEFPAFNRGEEGIRVAGFFSSDRDVANRFANFLSRGSVVVPAYLSFQKPYVIDAEGLPAGQFQFGETGRPFRNAVRSGKYDSVIIRNTADEGDVFIALRPEQIKSVFNSGSFDPDNPDINFRRANPAPAGQPAPQQTKTPLPEFLTALRKTNMLSAILRTSTTNVGGNVGIQLAEELSRVPASIIDSVISVASGKRTVARPMVKHWFNPKLWGQALNEFKTVMKQGATPAQLAAQNLPPNLTEGRPLADLYIKVVARLYTAEDAFFKTFAYRRGLEESARLIALKEKKQGRLGGKSLSQRIDEIVRGVGISNTVRTQMDEDAVALAEFLTYTNKNGLVKALDTLIKGGKVEGDLPGVGRVEVDTEGMPRIVQLAYENIFAFRNTPANVIARMLDYTPVGLFKAAGPSARLIKGGFKNWSAKDQKAFVMSLGRGGVGGLGFFLLGVIAASMGFAFGVLGDEEREERQLRESAGIVEGSIKIPGTGQTVQIINYGPPGALFVLGATAFEQWKEAEDKAPEESKPGAAEKLGKSLDRVVSTMIEQHPMIESTGQLVKALRRPTQTGGNFAAQQASTLVPASSLMRDVAAVTDSKEREASTVVERVKKNIPGLRRTLEPKTGVTGEEIPRTGKDRVVGLFARTGDTSKATPAMKEMVDLSVAPGAVKPEPGESKASIKERIGQRNKERTPGVDALVQSEEYGQSDRATRRAALKSTLSDEGVPKKINPGDAEMLKANAARTIHNTRIESEYKRLLAVVKSREDFLSLSAKQKEEAERELTNYFDSFRVGLAEGDKAKGLNKEIEGARKDYERQKERGLIEREVENILRFIKRSR